MLSELQGDDESKSIDGRLLASWESVQKALLTDQAKASDAPLVSWNASKLVRRGFDLIIASVMLALCGPALIAIAIAVRRDGGPALFRQHRVGREGWPFVCYKFRTMRADAEQTLARLLESDAAARAEWAATQKLKDDPRITTIGRFLRRTSLDELPQLLNVLRGDMSLVGPRPIPTYEVACYGPDILYYLRERPGITGLWQVSGRNDLDYRTRIELNSWYVKNRTFILDMRLLLKTVWIVIVGKGAF